MIDLNELKAALAKMQPRQQLYELVKAEMQRRKRWKAQRRGSPFTNGQDDRRNLKRPAQ